MNPPQSVKIVALSSDIVIQGANHLKWVMTFFEHLSGLKINYHKNDLIAINLDEHEEVQFSKKNCYKMGDFLFKYLGVPLYHEKLKMEDIQSVVDKTINRIPGWKGKLLSYGARLTLLKACLASIPIYLMLVIKFLKLAVKIINSHMTKFFWNDQEEKHKYHLSNWKSLYQKKEYGGLGIPDLRELNLCLLASWVQRFYNP
jgi:hypothetical protein